MNVPCRPGLLRFACLIGFTAFAVAPVSAQSTATPPATPTAAQLARYDKNKNGQLEPEELAAMNTAVAAGTDPAADVIELSPFEIQAEEDSGYKASSTLAGTRLNSRLEDLAASITVVTKEQLLDTAAVDINDIFNYESNTEGTGQFTDFVIDRTNVIDNVSNSPQTANRIRGLGAANIARGNFGSTSSIPIDTYNVDAIEISRGPNSNIFGLGEAAGTVNVITSRATLDRERSSFTTRADSWGGYRGSFDLNRPVFKDTLAVRLQGVYEAKAFRRKPSEDRTNRFQASVTFRPFKSTTIRGTYESYHNFNSRPNSVTPRDTTSYWRAAGSPTWNPLTWQPRLNGVLLAPVPGNQDANLPAGLFSEGTNLARPEMWIDEGQVKYYSMGRFNPTNTTGPDSANNLNMRYQFTGTAIMRGGGQFGVPPLPLFNEVGINDKSLYDWDSINTSAVNWVKSKADTYQLEVEQYLLNTDRHLLALQGGWYYEDSDDINRNLIGRTDGARARVEIDINERLLDDTPNPFFLRPFIGGSEPTVMKTPTSNDNLRGIVAYQLNLSGSNGWMKYLGKHRFAAYKEFRKIIGARGLRFRDQVISANPWITTTNLPNNVAGRLYPRYYMGDAVGQNIDYAPTRPTTYSGEQNLYWFSTRNGVPGSWINEKVTIGELYTGTTPAEQEIRTTGFSYQGFLLDDRIVPTFGLRKDNNRGRDGIGASVNATTGLLDYDSIFKRYTEWTERSGTTKTKGVVVKPLSWLYLHYNESDTFIPANLAFNVYNEVLPNPTGQGKDYGFTLNLFKNKLSLKYNQYETFEKDKRSTIGVIMTRIVRVESDGGNATGGDPDLEDFLTGEVATANPTWTPDQQRTEVLKLMQVDEGFFSLLRSRSLNDVNNATSKGKEIEINYNPDRYFTLKANITQQQAIDSDLSPNAQKYIDQRKPLWESIRGPATGIRWWEANNFAARNFFEGVVLAPLKLAITTQGKPKPQTREWRVNITTKYKLAGLKREGWIKNLDIGGSLRWEDKGAIGFLAGAPDLSDGAIRELDGNKPYWDKSRYYIDLLAQYRFRMLGDRMPVTLQFNARNIFENGRLQVVGVNPDGGPYAFRIIDPRQFILTATFDL